MLKCPHSDTKILLANSRFEKSFVIALIHELQNLNYWKDDEMEQSTCIIRGVDLFSSGSVNVVGLSHVIERTFHFYCICVSFFGGAAAVIDGKNKIIRCCIIWGVSIYTVFVSFIGLLSLSYVFIPMRLTIINILTNTTIYVDWTDVSRYDSAALETALPPIFSDTIYTLPPRSHSLWWSWSAWRQNHQYHQRPHIAMTPCNRRHCPTTSKSQDSSKSQPRV